MVGGGIPLRSNACAGSGDAAHRARAGVIGIVPFNAPSKTRGSSLSPMRGNEILAPERWAPPLRPLSPRLATGTVAAAPVATAMARGVAVVRARCDQRQHR